MGLSETGSSDVFCVKRKPRLPKEPACDVVLHSQFVFPLQARSIAVGQNFPSITCDTDQGFGSHDWGFLFFRYSILHARMESGKIPHEGSDINTLRPHGS
ncbi:MAG: hypothetical protein CVU64_18475 [Deltaproteobacteria bacterium HGW-Deltaproteobacteria-21]|jgi:hypothetical protein|nr:MAG: hypothetical protein CVU64_18475 [Deltaproteobacteria bacterium HGW-Deltaproteobacteria-21]